MYFFGFVILIFSLLITHFVIIISEKKKLFDTPDQKRKIHERPIANIGGVGLYFTILLSFFVNSSLLLNGNNYLLISLTLIFLFGLKDDLIGSSSFHRFIGQIFAGLIMIVYGDFRIHEISLLGIGQLNYLTSIFFSLFIFVFLTNSFNLIDGINGLLGSLTMLSCISFSLIFYFSRVQNSYLVSIVLGFSILGFLYFNFGNAKIFMGSCGSYLVGSLMYFFASSYLEISSVKLVQFPKYSILISILIIPIYDSLRVILFRTYVGVSPFKADSNHIHHRLLKLRFSHTQIVISLFLTNCIVILFNLVFKDISDLILLTIDFLILILLNIFIELRLKKSENYCIIKNR